VDLKRHFAMLAAYNRWANARLYETARGLPDGEYRADRGAFFSSLHGTLNHLLVADRIWMRRFTGTGPLQTRLDEILFEDLPALERARQEEDARIVAYVDLLSEAELAQTITYRTIVNPRDITQALAPALTHFFNHQTHHRGQAHALVTMAAGNAAMPSLDLIQFQRETGIGLA
jgi:uncharacterized damage-inducible protein DinB